MSVSEREERKYKNNEVRSASLLFEVTLLWAAPRSHVLIDDGVLSYNVFLNSDHTAFIKRVSGHPAVLLFMGLSSLSLSAIRTLSNYRIITQTEL